MAKAGYKREIDQLGRVVIPMQYRREMDLIDGNNEVWITCQNGNIVLSKVASTCIFCRAQKNLTEFKGKPVCQACLAALKNE